jgi:tetratricopeptide (TPR) repeat protein
MRCKAAGEPVLQIGTKEIATKRRPGNFPARLPIWSEAIMRRNRPAAESVSAEQALLNRARRCVRRGEGRKARLALREACFRAGDDPRLWALYGSLCHRDRQIDEARRAFSQALWLREQNRDTARAGVLRALIEHLDSGLPGELRAA